MSRLPVLFVAVAALLVLSVPPAATLDLPADAAAEPEPIDGCTTITEPGRYVLANDITRQGTITSGTCIEIRASDVTLDGDGHAFTGLGTSNSTAIYAVGVENVVVRDIRIADWHRAVNYRRVSNGEIRNVEVESSAYGVTLAESDGVTLTDSTISGNFVGVVQRGGGVELTDTAVEENHVDFDRD